MPARRSTQPDEDISFSEACARLEDLLAGPARREILSRLPAVSDLGTALGRLGVAMRSHTWDAGPHRVRLAGILSAYDRRTRQDGFHALHDWDGKADRVSDDTIPVDVLNFLHAERGDTPYNPRVPAILLDYYFVYYLALLSLRVWDEGDPDENVDRLNRLLEILQGPSGSGQRFADHAGTLLLVASSHYEVDEGGFAPLLARVRTLSAAHQLDIARPHAASVGCHLRFGFEATYARDTLAMRRDNLVDYPWLAFALATLLREYARLHGEGTHGAGRDALVEALLNGFSPDARAFVAPHPPDPLPALDPDRPVIRELFTSHRGDLLDEFERHRPDDDAYSPLAFFFNFSHNVLKGMAIDALLWGEPAPLALDDLFTGVPRGGPNDGLKRKLAATLMGYARCHPDRIGGRLMPAIVYDPDAGRRAFAVTIEKLRGPT